MKLKTMSSNLKQFPVLLHKTPQKAH